jgi:ribosomal protein S14
MDDPTPVSSSPAPQTSPAKEGESWEREFEVWAHGVLKATKIYNGENFCAICGTERQVAEREVVKMCALKLRDYPVAVLAEMFHDFYESYAQAKGWETNKASRVAFSELPEANRATMLCTASSVLEELHGSILMLALQP